MIEIEELSKSFGSKQVLNSINITFNKGRVYGIIGENGAGKTTLFKCIAGLEHYHGTIKSNHDVLKNNLGFLPTIPYFFSKITGREYIQLLCNARNIEGYEINEKNIFNLPLNQYAETYSTGMKKKLALTAILMQNNDIFLFDEPFNGVDIQSNIILTEIIIRLKELNKTIIVSSHIFSILNEICDEINLLKGGMFIKKVSKSGFKNLEKEIKHITIGNRIEKLNLK